MEVYTIGFAKKSAAEFFGALRQAGVKRLVDVRLKPDAPLAGFARARNLIFFLKELCGADYVHEPRLAPTADLLQRYREKKTTWAEYEREFLALLAERKVAETLDKDLFAAPAVLLCSEPAPAKCHRRLVAEHLQAKWGDVDVRHL
jgi:uncharacterized protein (DUF488 family)